MPDSEGQGRLNLKTVLSALAIMVLVATVTFLQISEHRTPRSASANQVSSGRITPGLAAVGGSTDADSEDTHTIGLNATEMPSIP